MAVIPARKIWRCQPDAMAGIKPKRRRRDLFAGKKNPTGGVGQGLDWEVLLVTLG